MMDGGDRGNRGLIDDGGRGLIDGGGRALFVFVSLKDLGSEALTEATGTLELQRVQRSCKTGYSISSYDEKTNKGNNY